MPAAVESVRCDATPRAADELGYTDNFGNFVQLDDEYSDENSDDEDSDDA